MITVVTWLWGNTFGPEYVSKLKSMVSRHLKMPHRFLCIADREWQDYGLPQDVERIDPPNEFREAPNCIRRMKMYDPAFAWTLGKHVLLLDLDVVIVDDITKMIEDPLHFESPLTLWRVGYPNHNRIFAGGVVLMRAGVLADMWRNFLADPLAFGTRALKHTYNRTPGEGWGMISDQAMLNYWLHRHPVQDQWSWGSEIQPYKDGLCVVPPGTKIITIGHDHLEDFQKNEWLKRDWR